MPFFIASSPVRGSLSLSFYLILFPHTPPLSFCTLIAGESSSCYGCRAFTWGASKSCHRVQAAGTFACGRQQILACTSRSHRVVHTCLCVCVYVCMCVYACVCVCIFMCVCVYMYTHTYIYVYVSLFSRPWWASVLSADACDMQSTYQGLSLRLSRFNSWQFCSECIGSADMCA